MFLEVPTKLNPKAFALALGIVWGLIIFLLTNISLLRGGEGEHLSRLSQFYIGYSFSFLGSLIGLVWGFVTMFVAALLPRDEARSCFFESCSLNRSLFFSGLFFSNLRFFLIASQAAKS